MQAEGGFGSRQFDIGCLDSVIEFGPQSFCRRQNNSACISILAKLQQVKKLNFMRSIKSSTHTEEKHSRSREVLVQPLWLSSTVRLRIIQESFCSPAWAAGFNSENSVNSVRCH
jgi:hypothetical protein